jgi:hypothetical protein
MTGLEEGRAGANPKSLLGGWATGPRRRLAMAAIGGAAAVLAGHPTHSPLCGIPATTPKGCRRGRGGPVEGREGKGGDMGGW